MCCGHFHSAVNVHKWLDQISSWTSCSWSWSNYILVPPTPFTSIKLAPVSFFFVSFIRSWIPWDQKWCSSLPMPRRVPERYSLCIYGVKTFIYIYILSWKKFDFPDNKCSLFQMLKLTLAIFYENAPKHNLRFSNFLNDEDSLFVSFCFWWLTISIMNPSLCRDE